MTKKTEEKLKLVLPASAFDGRLTVDAIVTSVRMNEIGGKIKVAVEFTYKDSGGDVKKNIYFGYDMTDGNVSPSYGEGLGEELARATGTLEIGENLVGTPVKLQLANVIGKPVQAIRAAV